MQTSQVSNAANVLTATPAPNKQADASAAAEPFGKVLSREVSHRNGANEAPKNKDAGNAASARQTAKPSESKSPPTSSEAKSAREGKPADKAQAEEETTGAAAALPEELLSLVANLNDMNTQAAQATDAQTLQNAAAGQDAQQAVAVTALPGVGTLAEARPAEAAAQLPTPASAIGTHTDATPLTVAGAGIKQDDSTLLPGQTESAAKAELPATTAANPALTAEDLNTQAAGQPAGAKAREFTAAMSESLTAVTGGMQSLPQAGLQALQQHGASAVERLAPRVGTPAWDQALGQKVVWMVAGEQQSASLTLNPPDLGPLQVVLNVNNSQANATFIAAQPEVRQALEAALPKLRDMLGEAGIQLGQASVNSGTPNQQGGFEQQGSQAARGHGQYGSRDTAGAEEQARVGRVQPASSGQGLVDVLV